MIVSESWVRGRVVCLGKREFAYFVVVGDTGFVLYLVF